MRFERRALVNWNFSENIGGKDSTILTGYSPHNATLRKMQLGEWSDKGEPSVILWRNVLSMRKLLLASGLLVSLVISAQEVSVLKFSELQKKILLADADVTVFNFWASWCGPCLRELPHFDAYADNENVKVYLVSLDFVKDLEKVKKLAQDKGLKSEVIFLNETDYNSYMEKVSKEWTGAIPATLFVLGSGKTQFYEKEFSKEELEKVINSYLN